MHNDPALGGYTGWSFHEHNIEGSIAQLVKNKALNLVDVGSSPMVEIILYDVIIKVQAQYYLTKPALGGYTLLFKFTWLYLQSPYSLLHNDPALGGYTGWSFHEHKAITSPESLQAYNPALGGYIIQIEITCKYHVAAGMHHDTWGIMQSHFY